jgi:hypothetical protein
LGIVVSQLSRKIRGEGGAPSFIFIRTRPFALGSFQRWKGEYMRMDALFAWFMLAGSVLFLALVVIFGYYCFTRVLLRRRGVGRRRSRLSGYGLALGLAFMQLVRVFYQPDVAYLLEVKQDEDADEDDSGDPESPEGRLRYFHRQLRRIRRGEVIDRLVLRR